MSIYKDLLPQVYVGTIDHLTKEGAEKYAKVLIAAGTSFAFTTDGPGYSLWLSDASMTALAEFYKLHGPVI